MKATSKCKRAVCQRIFSEHVGGHCPDGKKFRWHQTRIAASQSFGEAESRTLDLIVRGLLRGADIRSVVSTPGFSRLARKSKTMLAKIEAMKKERTG